MNRINKENRTQLHAYRLELEERIRALKVRKHQPGGDSEAQSEHVWRRREVTWIYAALAGGRGKTHSEASASSLKALLSFPISYSRTKAEQLARAAFQSPVQDPEVSPAP